MNQQFEDYSFDYFVEKSRWIFAKTYAKTAPHEYALRREFDEKDVWDKTVLYIRYFGKVQMFWGKPYTYYIKNEWKYWTMGEPLEETDLINRAIASEAEIAIWKIENNYANDESNQS